MNAYWLETKYEFLKLWRMPVYSASTLLYPLGFYVMFGLLLPSSENRFFPMAQYLLGTYGAFGVIGATIYALGVTIAVERGMGWMTVKRVSPMPRGAYLGAKVAVGLAFSTLVVLALFALGASLGGVKRSAMQWTEAGAMLVLGSVPFACMGIAIGRLAGANSAANLINGIHLPLGFCSGLWIPIGLLPEALQRVAEWLPYYHLGQIGLAAMGAPARGSRQEHFAILAAYTILFLLITLWAERRGSERMYG
ncbi:MAG: ABC transporter permease [Acidobacteriota bacterium]